ncbi:MAG TPA: hypothetical protein VIL46_18675, partial [Gemmataceae bacterium]
MSGYRILPAFAAAAGACAALLARAPDPGEPPYGIDKRIPWTTSRVVGSPDPPPPYRVRRVFEKLTLPCPMGVYAEPGTGKLILLHQLTPWVGASRILRIPNDPGVTEPEILLKPDRI